MEKENKQSPYNSPEFQVLGDKFIKICQKNKLDQKGIEITDGIFKEWAHLVGQQEEKLLIVLEKIKDYPHKSEIINSIGRITLAFLEESPTSPLGKFARKSKDN